MAIIRSWPSGDAAAGVVHMTSRPWMPLYVGDYLRDTQHLSTEEHGAYLLLIMHYWTHGGLPNDESSLKKICSMSTQKWNRSKLALARLFGPNWTHKRIEQELEKTRKITNKRKVAGMLGGIAKSKNRLANATDLLPVLLPQSQPHIKDYSKEPAVVGKALSECLAKRKH